MNSTKLTQFKFYQPKVDGEPNFETSRLRKKCWRVDVYPPKSCDEKKICDEHIMFFRFCVGNDDLNMLVRKYAYILDTRELGTTNKE